MNSQVSEFREKGNSPIIPSKTSRGAISGQLQKEALLSFSSLKFSPNSSVPRGKILDPLLPLFSEWAAVPPLSRIEMRYDVGNGRRKETASPRSTLLVLSTSKKKVSQKGEKGGGPRGGVR